MKLLPKINRLANLQAIKPHVDDLPQLDHGLAFAYRPTAKLLVKSILPNPNHNSTTGARAATFFLHFQNDIVKTSKLFFRPTFAN